jgi:transcriptional regulator with XRE-family HTH domain
MNSRELNLKKIGANIRKYRIASQLKQEYLGKKVNLSKSEISRIENGKRNAGFVKILEIANVIGKSINELMEE